MRRCVWTAISVLLELIRGGFEPKDIIHADVEGGRIVFELLIEPEVV